MRLIKQAKDGCVYASLAMVLGETLEGVYHNFQPWKLEDKYPFPSPWDELPRVPSMHEICEIAIRHYLMAFVPFEYDPEVTPHPDCPAIKVWDNAREVFNLQLRRGKGLIEGLKDNKGHMVAWNGTVVYDPRGYMYSLNVSDKFYFEPRRFWLAVNTK